MAPDTNYWRLFVYGTLREERVRTSLLGRPIESFTARLPGFGTGRRRHFYVVRRDGSEVEGAVLSGLTARDLEILDAYEDVPNLYTRERVEVIDSAGDRLGCWIYLPTAWARGSVEGME